MRGKRVVVSLINQKRADCSYFFAFQKITPVRTDPTGDFFILDTHIIINFFE